VAIVLTFVALFTLVPATVMVIVGARLRGRSSAVPRVPVAAVVVHLTIDRASRVTFDYPAPDGTWLRATRLCGLTTIRRQGWFVKPGDGLTVHVNPANPTDVSLGGVGSASGFGGIALVVAGVGLGFFGISQFVSIAVAAAR